MDLGTVLIMFSLTNPISLNTKLKAEAGNTQ